MDTQILPLLTSQTHRVLVIGAARSGIAATRLLIARGHSVVLFDEQPLEKLTYLLESGLTESTSLTFHLHKPPRFEQTISCVVASPGIAANHPLMSWARESHLPVISEIDVGMTYCPPVKIIGITGTNGKSTTTVMMESILKAAGMTAIACGNLGRPFCDVVTDTACPEYIVLELSSFQLESSNALRLDGAIIVNITPDHLDRHANFTEYRNAKLKIAHVRREGAPLVAHAQLRPITSTFAQTSYFTGHNFGVDDFASLAGLPLRGFHNQENAMAAALLAQRLDIHLEAIRQGLAQFKALPHRCQIVLQERSLLFVNDSKGTTVEAVKRALDSFSQPIHLLLGGIAKGEDFSVLNQIAYPHIKGYYVFGRDQTMIIDHLRSTQAHAFRDLPSAMKAAVLCAQPGDAILLSPGCASYDQFNDYQHRGQVFATLARKIMDETCEQS